MLTPPRRLLGVAVSCAMLTGLLAGPALAEDARLADSSDPTLASVDVALATFEAGSVDVLVIGRNDEFADNLGGAALAGTVGGPLLLTDGGPDAPLRPEVLEAVDTLVPRTAGMNCDAEPVNIYVLGGTSAVSADAVETLLIDGYCVERLEGPSRVETSVQVALEMQARGAGDSFMLARADNFADSAAAGALGARLTEPILLTSSSSLHPAVLDYIFPPDGEEGDVFSGVVTILGGTSAISQAVEDELASQLPGNSVGRIAGQARDETAVRIAEQFLLGEAGSSSDAVGLVNGFADDGWVYALISGAIAPVTNAPILYVQRDRLGDAVASYLDAQGPASILTFGPVDRVSDATAADARVVAGERMSE